MNKARDRALAAAAVIAGNLAPPPGTIPGGGWRQSLAKGAVGIALVHIERAHAGLAPWDRAHAWLKTAVAGAVSAADDAGLFCGAPAVAFALHAAGPGRYSRAVAKLGPGIAALAHRRVARACERIDRGELPPLAEFDLIYGLSGIGAHLLRNAPGSSALERILRYLVQLTRPLRTDGEVLPGWWASHDPSFTWSTAFAGGHANLGMAHGIAGPLALLALALRRGATVDGHAQAINRICAWLDDWRQDSDHGPWWPQWITRAELRSHRPAQPGPLRPSWCYGTPGIARAQQLAVIATGDTGRQRRAEDALARCLFDPAQLARLTGAGLCHGWAGLAQTAWRAACDARTPEIAERLPHLTAELVRRSQRGTAEGSGLLDGHAGLALALHITAQTAPPASGWDACLLIG